MQSRDCSQVGRGRSSGRGEAALVQTVVPDLLHEQGATPGVGTFVLREAFKEALWTVFISGHLDGDG